MAGTITAIVFQKKNKERVNVFVDDVFTLAMSLDAALDLKKGQYLSDEDIIQLKFKDDIDKAYQRALNYLAYRPRSQQEVEQYLQKKAYVEEVISLVVEQLISKGYINDVEFSLAWVETRKRLNPKGEQALRYELRQKGIAETDIDQVLGDLNEEELAWQAIEKKRKQWQKLDEDVFKKKLTSYLARRGFNYEVINNILLHFERKEE